MSKYRVSVDGEFEDEIFDAEEAAEDYANYLVGCAAQGAEDLYLSNPGDYPLEFADEYEIEVIEVDK